MKTTAEKIAVMQACLPDFSNLEVSNRGGWISYASQGSTTEPVWNWEFLDYRIKPSEPKKHEVKVWAYLLQYGNECEVKCIDEYVIGTPWHGTLLAVKPITFTITEGEGLDKA